MTTELNLLPQSSFVADVWKDFSSIDLSDYVKVLKHAGNAKYLSWSDAWTLIMDRYPYSVDDYYVIELDNKSVEVRCRLTISNGTDEFTREMHLPVMDSKNQAIFDPSSRAVSDTKARCMVKCASKFGLGLSLYSGDEFIKDTAPNVPRGDISADQYTQLSDLLTETNSDEAAFLKFFKVDSLAHLPASKFKNAEALLQTKLKKVKA